MATNQARFVYQTKVKLKAELAKLNARRMEPIDFCRKWVIFPEEERGWKSRCNEVLSDVLGVPIRTLERWTPNNGEHWCKRPEWVPAVLAKQDFINTIADQAADARRPPLFNSCR